VILAKELGISTLEVFYLYFRKILSAESAWNDIDDLLDMGWSNSSDGSARRTNKLTTHRRRLRPDR
jgi:hypothetical protein